MALAFLLIKDALIDDAYISLTYARNLALEGQWGLIPGETANTQTSTLNALLLGGLTALTRVGGGVHPVIALGGLSVGLAAGLAWAWTRIVRALQAPYTAAVVGVALVLANPFLLSAIGLETLLSVAVLMALAAMALEGRAAWFGALAGLAVLTRPDLVLFVVPVAVAAGAIRRRWALVLAVAALVAGPWFVFSWFHFGSAVPDTLLLKTSQPSMWGPWSLLTGPGLYYSIEPLATALAFLPAALGVVALGAWLALRAGVRWPDREPPPPLGPLAGLAVGGLAEVAAYALLDLPPYHWYYVLPSIALCAFLVAGLGTWWRQARLRTQLRPAAPAIGLAVLAALALAVAGRDLGQGIPWRNAVISTNFATPADYARAGEALRRRTRGATVLSPGEVGTLAFFCRCALLDPFSDRGYVVLLADLKIAKSGFLTRTLYRLNYHRLDRRQRPRHVDYRLIYGPGRARGRDSWPTWSPWRGDGHLTLTPA